MQENCLLACTKTEKTFKDLKIFEVYPNFSDCTVKEKKELETAHKLIIDKIK